MSAIAYDEATVTYDSQYVRYSGELLSSSGTVVVTSIPSGKATITRKTSGLVPSTAVPSGNVWMIRTASGSSDSISSTSGRASSGAAIAGATAALSAMSAKATRLAPISGSVVTTSVASGRTWISAFATGVVPVASTISLRAVVPQGVFVVSTSSGAVSFATVTSGSIAAVSGGQGAISVVVSVSGSMLATSSTSGRILATVGIRGLTQAVSSGSGAVSILRGNIRGTVSATSGASGSPTSYVAVSGQVGAVAIGRAAPVTQFFVRGLVPTAARLSGKFTSNHVISGLAPVAATAIGRIGQIQRASGTVSSSSGASASVARSGPIEGTVKAVTSALAAVTTSSTNRPSVANDILYDLDPDKIVGVAGGTALPSIPETVDGRDAVAPSGHQGTYVAADADFNGKPAVSLNGTTGYYVVPALATSATAWTVVLVIKPGSLASGRYFFDGVPGQSSAIYTDAANATGYSWMPATSRGDFGARSLDAQILVVQFAAGDSFGVQNGGTKGLDNTATVTPFGAFTLGASSALSGLAQADVARVLVYNDGVSEQDLINIDSWARGVYGIEVADFNTMALNALPIDITVSAQAWISTDSHQRFANPHGVRPVAGRATASIVLTAPTPVIHLGVPKLPAYSMGFPATITSIEGSSHIRTIVNPDPVWNSAMSQWTVPPGFSGVGDIRWSLQTLIDPTSFGSGLYPLGDRSANDGTDLIGDGATKWAADPSTGGPAWQSAYPFKPTVSSRDDAVSGGQTVHQDKGVLITSGSDAHMWLDMGAVKSQPFTWVIAAMPLRSSARSQSILDSGQDPYDLGFPALTPSQLANDRPVADNLPYRTSVAIAGSTATMYAAPGESGVSTSISPGTRPKMFCTVFNGANSTLYVRDTNGMSVTDGTVATGPTAGGLFEHRYYVLGREYGWVSQTRGCEMMVFEIRFFASALDAAGMADQYAQLSSTFQFDRYR